MEYLKSNIINYQLIKTNQMFNFIQDTYLPIYTLYTNGGLGGIYDGTDSIHDELVYYNSNNFLSLNPYHPLYKVYNDTITTISGMYYKITSKEFYRLIKSFRYKENLIEKYKNLNKNLFSILKKKNIELEDIFYTIAIRDNDIAENPLSVAFDIPENEVEFFEENENYFPKYHNSTRYTIQRDYYRTSLESKLMFMIKSLKMVNLKKNVKFIIYLTDSEDYIKQQIEEASEYIKSKKDMVENYDLNNFLDENKEKILTQKKNKKISITEYKVNKDAIMPLLYIDIKEDSEFEEFKVNQYCIAKYVVIKQIRASDDTFELSEEDMEKIYNTWNLKKSLPKMLFFGSILDNN